MKLKISFLLFVSYIILFTSCGPQGMISKMALHKIKPKHDYGSIDTSYAPDYRLSNAWYVSEYKNMPVDIFFIHSTSYKKMANGIWLWMIQLQFRELTNDRFVEF